MKRTVLYIEDQYHNRRLVEKVLSAREEVLLAEDGPTGWEILKERRPSLVLLDIAFPGGLDGLPMSRHASRRIRTSGEYGHCGHGLSHAWRSRAVSEPGL